MVGGDDAAGQGGVTFADSGQRFAGAYTMHAPGIAVFRGNELQRGQELVTAALGHAQRIALGNNSLQDGGVQGGHLGGGRIENIGNQRQVGGRGNLHRVECERRIQLNAIQTVFGGVFLHNGHGEDDGNVVGGLGR